MKTATVAARLLARLPRMLVFGVIALFSALPFAALFLLARSSILFQLGYAGLAGCILWFLFCVLIFFLELATGDVGRWGSDA
jgi:hypothetical protein